MSESYDFNKREDYDYSHSFDYLGGVGLGKTEVRTEKDRVSKLGKYDLAPVDPPIESAKRDEIINVANLIHKSAQRESLFKKINELRDIRTEFVWNKSHEFHAYFVWALHCIDRQVPNWLNIGASSSSTDPDAQSVLQPLLVGDWVDVNHVQARPELNGKRGIVLQLLSSDRVKIDFPDINQAVSLPSSKCTKSNRSGIKPVPTSQLPQAIKVEVVGLTSDSGKLLNGFVGYVVGFNNESQRYTVRLDEGTKSLKKENLYVCLPPGWEGRFDESSGDRFYTETASGKVSWEHPILAKPRPVEGPHNEGYEEGSESDFDRVEFLEQEKKRIRLDRDRAAADRNT